MKNGSDYRLDYILHKGDQIHTDHAVYTISGEPLGFGGSSILYPARKEGSELEVAIKEWFPKRPANFERRHGIIQPKDLGDTVTLEKNRKLFEIELKMGEQIRNATAIRAIHLWGILKPIKIIFNGKAEDSCDVANGLFAVMERMDQKGKTFNQLLRYISEKPSDDYPLKTGGLPKIHTTALIMEQVLLALQRVHEAGENGYIFGDIQDGNIYFADCRLEQGDIGTGMLLDFGCTKPLSLIEGKKLYEYKGENIFSSQGYIPPEIADPEAHDWQLTQKADIYSAGCLMLRCLLSRYKIKTLGDTPYYKDDLVDEVDASDIGCSESNRRLVNHILEKAMRLNPEDRPSVDEMLEEIQELKRDTAPPTYLLPKAPGSSESFVEGSRDAEIDSVMHDLEINKPVFLWGCGGIGKSEIAIKVAQEFEKHSPKGAYFIHYTVPFDKAQEAMEETILRMPLSGFIYEPESGMSPEEQRKAEYKKRIRILTDQYAGALLVIDNFDWPGKTLDDLRSEQSYQEITSIGLNLLFTTRNEVPGTPEVKELSRVDLLKLMRRWCTDLRITDQQLLDLIEAVDGHTLTVDIIAKTLEESWGDVTPEMILETLRSNRLAQADYPEVTHQTLAKGQDSERFHHRDPKTAQIYGHLKTLFDLTGMSRADETVLCCATLLPDGGMDAQLFRCCLEGDEKKALQKLVKRGWLRRTEKNMLTIHPMILEVVGCELKPTASICSLFLIRLKNYMDSHNTEDSLTIQIAECFIKTNSRQFDETDIDFSNIGFDLFFKIIGEAVSSGNINKMLVFWKKAMIPLVHFFEDEMIIKPANKAVSASALLCLAGCFRSLSCYESPDFPEEATYWWTYSINIQRRVFSRFEQTFESHCLNVAHIPINFENAEKLELESIQFYKKVLSGMKNDLSEINQYLHDLSESYHRLAGYYEELDDVNGCLECMLEEIHIRKQKTDEEKYIEQQNAVIDIIDKIYWLARETETDKKKQIYTQLFKIDDQWFDPNSVQYASFCYYVGRAYYDMAVYDRSVEYLDKAITLREGLLPQNHLDLAAAYAFRCSASEAIDDLESALIYCKKANDALENNSDAKLSDLRDAYLFTSVISRALNQNEDYVYYQEKVVYILEKMLPQGHSEIAQAYYETGQAYANIGEFETALAWYSKAARAGNVSAMNKLANWYFDGKGCPKDSNEAFYWWDKAHRCGHVISTNNLGWAYLHGYGCTKNISQAIQLFEEAAVHPSEPSKAANRHLGKLYLGIHPQAPDFDGIDPVKALYYLERAKELGATDVDELILLAKSEIG